MSPAGYADLQNGPVRGILFALIGVGDGLSAARAA
jgi:hypothetical protein